MIIMNKVSAVSILPEYSERRANNAARRANIGMATSERSELFCLRNRKKESKHCQLKFSTNATYATGLYCA